MKQADLDMVWIEGKVQIDLDMEQPGLDKELHCHLVPNKDVVVEMGWVQEDMVVAALVETIVLQEDWV